MQIYKLYALVLVLVLPGLAVGQPVETPDAAISTALALVSEIGELTRNEPSRAGAFAPWQSGNIRPDEPILVYSYPELLPSYYFIPLLGDGAVPTSFVTVDARSGDWQAFGALSADRPYPQVTPAAAPTLARRIFGVMDQLPSPRVVSMPNKKLYWYWNIGSAEDPDEYFINLDDETDSHAALDQYLAPTTPRYQMPRAGSASTVPTASSGRSPISWDIPDVPHHTQETSYHCGPAATEMVLDFWGPDINQTDIGHVANCQAGIGSYADDNRRAGHFSHLSGAVMDPGLRGYHERSLGYGALSCWWSYPNVNDPDFGDRYKDLRDLLSAGYPILVLTYYDASHAGGHFRVVKGYDDISDVLIVHDPWYAPPYYGPDVHFNQGFFIDDLWTTWYRWGTLIAPWQVAVNAPAEVVAGAEFTVEVNVLYRGPHPYEGQDIATSSTVEIQVPEGFELASGEIATANLTGLRDSDSEGYASWQVVGDNSVGMGEFMFEARGLITDSSQSYTSYTDQIGGQAVCTVNRTDPTGAEPRQQPALCRLQPNFPNPFNPTTSLRFSLPDERKTRLEIFNLAGRRIATLVDDPLRAGYHTVTWHGCNEEGEVQPSGTYFCRLTAGSFQQTQRMSLLR